ncbi:hypothetical protein BSKO_11105 [Bryopsis sp. KO-2023]|nr:hypothetical protein BSKO_11105 [Bryopsis sp. KO-2023]
MDVKRKSKKFSKTVGAYTYKQYHVVGRHLPGVGKATEEDTPLYRMKIWAKDHVKAKSKFWFFLKRLRRVKKANGQIISVTEIPAQNPTVPRNYGVWIRCQSRTGTHNMYKEYRDVTMNGAVEQMYNEMSARHRVRVPQIQIIRVAELTSNQCKRSQVVQFHDSKIKFPVVQKKYRAPQHHMRKLYAYNRPTVSMF